MEKTLNLIRFTIGEVSFAIDPYEVEAIVSRLEGETYRPCDLAERLGLSLQKSYRKAIVIKPAAPGRVSVGILVEEIEQVEELPVAVLKRLPAILEKSIRVDFIVGLTLIGDTVSLILDGAKLANCVLC